MIKESIVNLKKSLRMTLQNVPAVVDTLIRGLDEVEDAAEEQSTYSTDEKVVGTWIDGKTIYEKTFEYGALPNNTLVSKEHGVANIDNIVYMSGIAVEGNTTIPVPFIGENNISMFITKVAVFITTSINLSTYNCTVTFRYTKTTANRSPENDTKNGGDEPATDPDVKTVDDVVEPVEELEK